MGRVLQVPEASFGTVQYCTWHVHHLFITNFFFRVSVTVVDLRVSHRNYIGRCPFSFFLSLTSSNYSLSFAPDHTQGHTHTLGRTPLDEGSARRTNLYLATHNI
jgi:hypothetical protein